MLIAEAFQPHISFFYGSWQLKIDFLISATLFKANNVSTHLGCDRVFFLINVLTQYWDIWPRWPNLLVHVTSLGWNNTSDMGTASEQLLWKTVWNKLSRYKLLSGYGKMIYDLMLGMVSSFLLCILMNTSLSDRTQITLKFGWRLRNSVTGWLPNFITLWKLSHLCDTTVVHAISYWDDPMGLFCNMD